MQTNDKKSAFNKHFLRITSEDHSKEFFDKRKLIAEQKGRSEFVVHTLSEYRNETTSYAVSISISGNGRTLIRVNSNICTLANLKAVLVGAWIEES
ncbi:hypothetical protein OTK49_03490 [Vibrio coralliirubri]|uniref:hypothetical protein n=1 Tax=Vibrio coralliirubri TaxID=1516159 RepID=UPI0022846501|nr:hypothetical protein [Vibrio coralliirubri]MCY9861581.1 hypothetical protein [Vibrio coralliirubri]